MTYDTLEYNGTEKTLTDWGFSAESVRSLRRCQSADTFTATIINAMIADECTSPTFPFEAQIICRTNRVGSPGSFSGGLIKFQGKRVDQPLRAASHGQGVTYKFRGPWYDLENTHLQQTFKGASTTYLLAETVLNTSTAVTSGQVLISVGDQLQATLQWLLDQYAAQGMAAPFQYKGRTLNAGAIDLNSTSGVYNYALDAATTISAALFTLFLPTYITKPLMCSDVIQKCLEMSPRASVWFDYTTTPPTFHCTLPANKVAKTLPLFDAATHKSLTIQRRDDLRVRAVNILYRITSTVDGAQVVDYAPDKWGAHGSNNALDPSTGLRVVNELIDLQGGAITTAKGHLDVEPVVINSGTGGTTQAFKRAWWSLKRGGEMAKLEDSRVRFQDKAGAATTIPDATIVNSATGAVLSNADLIAAGFKSFAGALVLNRLVRGTHHSWMKRTDGQAVVSMKVKLVAKMTYATYDVTSVAGTPDTDTTGVRHTMHNSEEHHANIEITNGVTGDYSTTASVTGGEAYIIGAGGIAQYLYNHLNSYQYDGDAVHVGASFADVSASNYVDLGNMLNLSGGVVEWLTMNAQIQSIEEDWFKKTVNVQIGVANHLNAGQLSSLLNAWRFRRPWFNPALRSDNAAGGTGGLVDLPVTAGSANSLDGVVNNGQQANVDYSTAPVGSTPGVISGKIDNNPNVITTILAATTPTPVGTAEGMKVMQPRELKVCDDAGNIFYVIVHATEGHTKP